MSASIATEDSLGYIDDEENYHFLIGQVIFPIIGGFMFGYDTGVISGALLLLRKNMPNMTTIKQEIVVSSTILAAAISSLLAGILSNKYGRKKVIVFSCICFVMGSLVMGAADSFSILILGRAIVGIGVGMSATCCPVYISEISPEKIRGRLIVAYQISITAGMFFASFFDAWFNYIPNIGWKFMLAVAAVPSLIEFIGMLTVPESYRWLISQNRIEEARVIIMKQCQIPEDKIDAFIEYIVQKNEEIEDYRNKQNLNNRCLISQIFQNKPARHSLLIGCSLQMLSQIIGINTIMYYTAPVIQMSGVRDLQQVLWLSALVTLFNFIPSFIGYKLIDKIGRRKLAIISLIGVLISLTVLAITFQVIAATSQRVTHFSNNSVDNNCKNWKTCEQCVTASCGFCVNSSHTLCLAPNSSSPDAPKSCSKETNGMPNWFYGYCLSNFSWIVIFGMILYLISFSIGMGPIPWTITSEIYPLWCRSANMAMSTATNWIFNLIISLTFLSLTESITRYGTFWLYASLSFCGLFFLYKFLPETNQRKLEEITELINPA